MNAGVIIMCACAFIICYFTSGMLVTILMEKFGYELSINIMTKYLREEIRFNDGDLDEDMEAQAMAVNMQIRIVITLLSYAILAFLEMFASTTDDYNRTIVTAGFVGLVGLLINLLFALILEYQCWPRVMYYKGTDDGSQAHFVEVFADDGAIDLTLDTDIGINAEELFEKNDMVIILLPPTGDAIWNPLM